MGKEMIQIGRIQNKRNWSKNEVTIMKWQIDERKSGSSLIHRNGSEYSYDDKYLEEFNEIKFWNTFYN